MEVKNENNEQKYPFIVEIYFRADKIYRKIFNSHFVTKKIYRRVDETHFSVEKVYRNIVGLSKIVFTGFWLGILKRETFHLIDNKFFNNDDNRKIYHNNEYNRSGFFEWEKIIIENYFQQCKSLLVTSAGGGREMLALMKRGYEVEGFECNNALVECAHRLFIEEGFPPRIQSAPRDQCPPVTKIYDGIIVGWSAYMYIQGRTNRIAFLKILRKLLRERAPILLSFFAYPDKPFYFRMIKAVANSIRWPLGRELAEAGDDLVPNYVHIFNEEEIASELNEAGFQLELYSTDLYGHAVGFAVR
ncbi:MAG: SAM-dependent methyltransferase [bacterium]